MHCWLSLTAESTSKVNASLGMTLLTMLVIAVAIMVVRGVDATTTSSVVTADDQGIMKMNVGTTHKAKTIGLTSSVAVAMVVAEEVGTAVAVVVVTKVETAVADVVVETAVAVDTKVVVAAAVAVVEVAVVVATTAKMNKKTPTTTKKKQALMRVTTGVLCKK